MAVLNVKIKRCEIDFLLSCIVMSCTEEIEQNDKCSKVPISAVSI